MYVNETMITKLLSVPYVPAGRTWEGADCWGLTRLARQWLRGDLAQEHAGVDSTDKSIITSAAQTTIDSGFRRVDHPRPATIAAVWRGAFCVHVGIVIETDIGLAVLETNRKTGPRWLKLSDFVRRYGDVRYYDDRD
jgi:hypothetical protein